MKKKLFFLLISISLPISADYKIILNSQSINLPNSEPTQNLNHTFTNCGQNGRFGPSLTQCKNEYENQNILKEEYKFNVNSGIQFFEIPKTGIYTISVAGAQGGDGIDENGTIGTGGYGAFLKGDFNLTEGETIKIVVGQKGSQGYYSNADIKYGGGGGGTFVAKVDNTPLIVAAGGGGANRNYNGINGSTDIGDGYGLTIGNGKGGCGGGFFTDGDCSSYTNGDGQAFVNGSLGGKVYDSITEYDADGGFGGGSGTRADGSGAGGGYSGGSGQDSPLYTYDGVSAMSYNSGSNKESRINFDGGHGMVTIKFIE